MTGAEAAAVTIAAVGASVVAILVLKQVAPTLFTVVVQQAVPARPLALPPSNYFLDSPPRGLAPTIV